jgi:hypothetical protein
MTETNHFSQTISAVERAPTNQKASKLIDSIAQQMTGSNDPQTQQLGQELASVKSQLLQACQQS